MPRIDDPRPLVGEPLSLDLLNTRWVDGGTPLDLLDTVAGLRTWLHSAGLADRATADEETLAATRRARDALYAVVEGEAGAAARVNELLDHGRVRRVLGDDGPTETVEVDDPAWLPGWLAADDYLTLRRKAPERIRKCAGAECVLYFFDTSQNGTRRWCSMAACGNRAKAARHYARRKATR